MPRISTDNYDTVAAWNGSQDLFVVEQPDGTKVATPAMVKQFIEAGDFEATGEVKDGHGNILADMVKTDDLDTLIVAQTINHVNTTPIPAGNYAAIDIPINKPGYTPVGVVGISGSGTGKLSVMEFFVRTDDVRIYYMNSTGNTITPTSISIRVLFVKS